MHCECELRRHSVSVHDIKTSLHAKLCYDNLEVILIASPTGRITERLKIVFDHPNVMHFLLLLQKPSAIIFRLMKDSKMTTKMI